MSNNLFMVLLGCKPKGRFTEQHDIYFGIAHDLPELKNNMLDFWPEARGELHIDAWKRITHIDNYQVRVKRRDSGPASELKLFFVNLGGYKDAEFEEYHYKQLIVGKNLEEVSASATKTKFYKHHISPHIDDKYGLDIDDIFDVEDVLDSSFRDNFTLEILPTEQSIQDVPNIGYLKFSEF